MNFRSHTINTLLCSDPYASDGSVLTIHKLMAAGHNPHAIHPEKDKRSIDYAAQAGNLLAIQYLVQEQHVALATPTGKPTANLFYWACTCTDLQKRKEILNWLLEDDRFLELKCNVTKEHILAALGKITYQDLIAKNPQFDIRRTDSIGYLPEHYAVLSGFDYTNEQTVVHFYPSQLIEGISQLCMLINIRQNCLGRPISIPVMLLQTCKYDRIDELLNRDPMQKISIIEPIIDKLTTDNGFVDQAPIIDTLAMKVKLDLFKKFILRRKEMKIESFYKNISSLTAPLIIASNGRWDILELIIKDKNLPLFDLSERVNHFFQSDYRSIGEMIGEKGPIELMTLYFDRKKCESSSSKSLRNKIQAEIKKQTGSNSPGAERADNNNNNQPLSPLDEFKVMLNKLLVNSDITYQITNNNNTMTLAFTGDKDTIKKINGILKKHIIVKQIEKKTVAKPGGKLEEYSLTAPKEDILIKAFKNNKMLGELDSVIPKTKKAEPPKPDASKTDGDKTENSKTDDGETDKSKIEQSPPIKRKSIVPKDDNKKVWQERLPAAFCHAAGLKVQWDEAGCQFIVTLPDTNEWKVRGYRESHSQATKYRIPESIKNEILSRLEDYFQKSDEATVTRHGNEFYFSVSEEQPQPFGLLQEQIYAQIKEKCEQVIEEKPPTEDAPKKKKQISDENNSVNCNESLAELVMNLFKQIYPDTPCHVLQVEINKAEKCKISYKYDGLKQIGKLESKQFFTLMTTLLTAEMVDIKLYENAGKIEIVVRASAEKIRNVGKKALNLKQTFSADYSAASPHENNNSGNYTVLNNHKETAKTEADAVNVQGTTKRLIRAIKEFTAIEQSNLSLHLEKLLKIPHPKGQSPDKAQVYHHVYLLHALRIFEMLGRSCKTESEKNYFENWRNVIRHAYDKLSWDELYEVLHPFIIALDAVQKQIKPASGFGLAMFVRNVDIDETVIAKLANALQVFEKEISTRTLGKKTKRERKHIEACYVELLSVTENSQIVEDYKRDGMLMALSLIGERNTHPKYKDVYINLGHYGFDKPWDAFANDLYNRAGYGNAGLGPECSS